ncbi:MAG: EamA/RhaT family transporter [Novosphingobium sp.]|nr:EamA/RhaT family transporter [Novosphingobium sp.]
MVWPFLWVPLTLAASAAQVVRNGAQASLTAKIGTLGATQVRFVYGLPFAVIFLSAALAIFGESFPQFDAKVLGWTALGGACQIGGTALMLVVMGRRAFSVGYAYIKTEPVTVALLGVVILGDTLPALSWLAIAVVTVGVLVASLPPDQYRQLFGEKWMISVGILSGTLFGLSSIAFRGGIEALPDGGFVVRSLSVLVASLVMQTVMLGGWLALFDRAGLFGSIREWRRSVGAGLAGATASAFFFTAFSLTPAANVRTLALADLPFAALLSGRLTGQRVARHELAGMSLVMAGVLMLLAA